MASLRYYHHCDCEDRPAAVTCSERGKSLCRETEKKRCVDFLNAELQDDVRRLAICKNAIKKEAIKFVVGFILGLIVQIALFFIAASIDGEYATMMFSVSLFLFFPTLFASFGTIWRTSRNARIWLLRIPFFLILCIVSPIIFIVNIVKCVRFIKLVIRFSALKRRKQRAYADYAKQMLTVCIQAEFKRETAEKYFNHVKEDLQRLDIVVRYGYMVSFDEA